MEHHNRLSPAQGSLRIALLYLSISVVWIFFSDRFFAYLFPETSQLTAVQTLKGSIFVLITAYLMFVLIRRELSRQDDTVRLLEQSQRSLDTLMINLPGMVYRCENDKDWTMKFVSQGCHRLTGYPPHELIDNRSRSYADIIDPADREMVWLQVQEQLEKRLPFQLIYRIRTSSGQTRWVWEKGRGIFRPDGSLEALEGFVTDVTERIQAEERVRKAAERTQALAEAASRLNVQLDLTSVAGTVCAEAARCLGVQTSLLLLYDEEREVFKPVGTHGLPQEFQQNFSPIPFDLYERFSRKMGPFIVIPDIQSEPDLVNGELFKRFKIRTVVILTLTRDGRIIGILQVYSFERAEFNPEELSMLKGVSSQCVQALINARLYENARRRLQRVRSLHKIDLAISSSLDLKVTFSLFLDQVVDQLAVDGASISLCEENSRSLRRIASRGLPEPSGIQAVASVNSTSCSRAVLQREFISVPDLQQADVSPAERDFLQQQGFRAYFAVPLLSRGEVKGVLEVFSRKVLIPDREWVDFLEALAGQAAIAVDNAALFDHLQHSNAELLVAYDSTLEGWARALELRDKETQGHSERVTQLTLKLARAMGVKGEELVNVRRGALLHDIGKMGIPDSILLKPGSLDEEEWDVMRKHTLYARDMLSPIEHLKPALDIPLYHHEKWDGSGYPFGLKGETIPLGARIFAVIDVWDALRSDRPYRKKWPLEKIQRLLREESGKHFDPRVVEAFFKQMEELLQIDERTRSQSADRLDPVR